MKINQNENEDKNEKRSPRYETNRPSPSMDTNIVNIKSVSVR